MWLGKATSPTVAATAGASVDVVGHSYGGRIGLGAALRTDAIRRLVVYEGAPHSFFDRKQEEFAAASDDAWQRTLDFVAGHS